MCYGGSMENFGIPLAALIVSIAGMAYSIVTQRRLADKDRVIAIEMRLRHVEAELNDCTKNYQRLLTENIELMRRLAGMEKH
jgi:hypothetical protein